MFFFYSCGRLLQRRRLRKRMYLITAELHCPTDGSGYREDLSWPSTGMLNPSLCITVSILFAHSDPLLAGLPMASSRRRRTSLCQHRKLKGRGGAAACATTTFVRSQDRSGACHAEVQPDSADLIPLDQAPPSSSPFCRDSYCAKAFEKILSRNFQYLRLPPGGIANQADEGTFIDHICL